MAASRSVLEALLARVQKRANEPRQSSVVLPSVEPRPALASREPTPLEAARPLREELADDDIEEYDEELIEIIDDAEVIPQAAAAARAIEPAAFSASLDRRPAAGAKPAEPLRGEAVAARPIAATDVARVQGSRRELRSRPFVELLDASLELGKKR